MPIPIDRSEDFANALRMAQRLVGSGELISYRSSCEPVIGRVIHVQSDQGWDPEPIFQEFDQFGFPPERD